MRPGERENPQWDAATLAESNVPAMTHRVEGEWTEIRSESMRSNTK